MKTKHIAWSIGAILASIGLVALAPGHAPATPAPIVTAATSTPGVLPTVPGVTNPNVMQDNIQQTICVSGWTATIRPPASYTTALKIKELAAYGWADQSTGDYEEDHLISLELGGNPTDPNNLWPESYKLTPNAHDKDHVENWLKAQVCAGTMTLAQAQSEIVTDWTAVLAQIGSKPTYGALDDSDPDDN